jgi:adenine-specific DNA-methyltransferase
VQWDSTRNVFIEGDNLEVLKLLQKSYHRKVKLIYVAPPYNTGRDIIYPGDNPETIDTYLKFASKTGLALPANSKDSGRYHTNWLNMMYPRLFLARNLLRDDGYFAVNIDDTERKNLESLLDEIFGEENRLAVLVLNRSRKNDARFFSVGHEYIVIYARDKATLEAADVRLREAKEGIEELRSLFSDLRAEHRDNWAKVEQGIKHYFKSIPKGDPRESLKRFKKVDARGPFRTDGDISWPGDDDGPRYDVPHPTTGRPCEVPSRGWVYPTFERMKEQIEKGSIVFGADEKKIPSVKRYLFETSGEVMGSVWSSYAQTTAQEFKRLFDNKKIFDNPKDPRDLRRLIDYLTGPNDTIVDLFAGSATTAHAVFMSNAGSGSSRRFICVQLPEVISDDEDTGKKAREFLRQLGVPPVVSSIARERIRRAAKSLAGSRNFDSGFRSFRLDRTNIKPWNVGSGGLDVALSAVVNNIDEASTQDDVLYELLLKYGLDLATEVEEREIVGKRVFVIGAGALVVCLDDHIDRDLAHGIAELKSTLNPAIMRVVFKDAGFRDDVTKANAVQTLKQAGVNDVRSL